MEIEGVLNELRNNRGRFPRQALVAAIERSAEVTPHLIESIDHARQQAKGLPSGFIQYIYVSQGTPERSLSLRERQEVQALLSRLNAAIRGRGSLTPTQCAFLR